MIDSINTKYYDLDMNELYEVLRQSQDRQGMTIDDLVDEADRLLPVVADNQTRYKVTDRPDVRWKAE